MISFNICELNFLPRSPKIVYSLLHVRGVDPIFHPNPHLVLGGAIAPSCGLSKGYFPAPASTPYAFTGTFRVTFYLVASSVCPLLCIYYLKFS